MLTCAIGHTHIFRRENTMGIGLGVVLLLLGLILVLGAVNLPASVDKVVATDTLGWILVIVGVLALVLALVVNQQRTRSSHVVEERRVDPPV
jgi:fumarate reductase subunit D